MKETTQDNIIWTIGLVDVTLAIIFFFMEFKYHLPIAFVLFVLGTLLIIGDAMKQSHKEMSKKYPGTFDIKEKKK